MKRLGIVLAVFAVVLFTGTALAQEQTGQIVGKITADGGESLPGVSIEIKGPSGTLVAVTDAKGDYRFARVTPGAYKLTARLQGFQTYEASRISVALGDRATVNVTLKISSVMETVVVTGERVQIAVGENSTTATMASEQISLLPKGRDFTSIVAQAAGASQETLMLGGISIDGASGSENRFVIDGVDTTQPQDGLSGQQMITDFIEEVQVKSAGYSAEFGGALGGVINAITKSGTNEFHGFVGLYYGDSSLNSNANGDDRPVYQQSWPGYYRTYDKDDATSIEPGFALGGPIIQDKLWFFAGYNPNIRKDTRVPYGSTTGYDMDRINHFFSANLKGNVGSKFVYKISANISPFEQDGNLPAFDGSTPAEADLDVNTDIPTSSYSAYADFVPTNNFYVSGRLGMYETDTETGGLDATNRISFTAGIAPFPTDSPLYKPTGFTSVPLASFRQTDEDSWKRTSAGFDLNLFATALGSHSFKAGVQYELIKNKVVFGDNGNFFETRWGLSDRFGQGVRGTYGSVAVYRFQTVGSAESTNIGLFIQDTWAIHPNFTLNLGVRTEQERVPNYGFEKDPTLPEYAMEFNFEDKLAPRLGFSWDVTGKQQLKAYGSYGTYYDITKLEMPRGSFGADRWITHVYPINEGRQDWTQWAANCGLSDNLQPAQNPCGNYFGVASKNRDLRRPTDPTDSIDPDLQPMENREFQLGLDYQLTKNSVVSARYVNKKLINTIEDIGYLVFYDDGTSGEEYITGNPGKGIVAGDPDGAGPLPAQPEAIRDYEAIELTFNKRFSNNYSLRASYVYSSLTGNYSGLASSDEFGRTDPNVARYFDGLAYGFASDGSLVDGELNTDRPHAFEVQGVYQAPWGTNVGLNFSYASGSPVSTDASFNGVNFFPNGRNDMGRLSAITQTDLLLAHPFKIGDFSLELSLNVINLFDEAEVTRVGNVKYFDDVCDATACDGSNAEYFGTIVPYNYDALMEAYYGGPEEAKAAMVPSYGRPLAFQGPRTFRFGLKFIF
ncbi:MAG: TonB-dependent receptor [Holophagales bacterium]|nr:TonB-dependent receptor [Holophagales bacterium]